MNKPLYNDKKLLIGTIIEVVSPYKEAAGIVFHEVERVEKVFSIYRDDSSVAHLNKTGFLNTNFEVFSLVKKAKEFYGLTEGQFDITVAPLARLWKAAFKENKIPTDEEIKGALALVDFNRVGLDSKNNNIQFLQRGMQVDFGAFAKGYAVDCAVDRLKEEGIDSAIVNAGGDIYCLGKKFNKPWKIGIQNPRDKNSLLADLELEDSAVATSGDYEQFVEINGKRYSHIIDPRTGYPVDNDVASVTVVAKNAITADIVATSVFLLGKEKGIRVFEKYEGVEKIIVIEQGDMTK
jgi:thiamine biosynthesis lipoprotein